MNDSTLLRGLFLSCALAMACDQGSVERLETSPRSKAIGALYEDFAIEVHVARFAHELELFVPLGQECRDGDSYRTETTETIRTCDEDNGTIVEVTYTRQDTFVCREGQWELEYSVCLYDECSPKIEVTDEPCEGEAAG